MDKLFYNGIVITVNPQNEIIENGSIYIKDNKIEDVGRSPDLLKKYLNVDKQDVNGKAILPGLVNTHSHTSLTSLKGLAEDVSTFVAVYGMMPTVRACLDDEGTYNMSRSGLVEMIQSGTTTLVETSAANIEPSAYAMRDIGIRGFFGAGMITDYEYKPVRYGQYIHNPLIGEKSLLEAERIFSKWNGIDNGRIKCMFYPHSTETCSLEIMKEVKKMSDKYEAGVTTHLAQNYKEVDRIDNIYGKTPTEFLDTAGLLNERFIGAHCVYMSEADYTLMAKNDANFAHCPIIINKRGNSAATYNAVKVGTNVTLGTDNMFADMMETMRFVITNARIRCYDTELITPELVLKMATRNGAKSIGMLDKIGSLEIGKFADMIMIDLNQLHLTPVNEKNVVSTIVYNGMGKDVVFNMINGKVIYEKGGQSSFDEYEVVISAQKSAEKAWVDFEKFF